MNHTGFNILIVSVDKVSNCERRFYVKGSDGVVESVSLLDNPGESALFDEDALGQFAQNRRVNFVERSIDFEILGEELGPRSVALGVDEIGRNIGSLCFWRCTNF